MKTLEEAAEIIKNSPKGFVCEEFGGTCDNCPISPYRPLPKDFELCCHNENGEFKMEILIGALRKKKLEKLLS